jgi:hypothetical protein
MQLSQQEKDRLRKLYLKATYEVCPHNVPEPLHLRPEEQHPEIDAEFEGAESWMLITAHEPMGQPHPPEINKQAQQKLHLDIKRANKNCWPGRGYDPRPEVDWEEPCLFVFPVSRQEALRWAERYRQLAVLFGERGQAAELLFTQKV